MSGKFFPLPAELNIGSNDGDAPDEFVSEYSVPWIITQYQVLLFSIRDYYSVSGIITQYKGLSGFLFSFGLDWSNR